jgi:ATP-dependent Lon protease
MPKDDDKKDSSKRKNSIEEDMDGIEKENILPKGTKRTTRKRKPDPPPSDDNDEENDLFILDIADLISSVETKQREESPNEMYLKSISKKRRRILQKEEREVMRYNECTIPLRYKIIGSNLPKKTKAVVMQKVEQFENSYAGASGYHKLKTYMDTLLKIPFGKYHELPVKKTDNVSKISGYLNNLKNSLDKSIYGQDNAKIRIMEIVAKWITNPDAKGNVIGLCGPPGVGKTTLIKQGLSSAINMPFSFVGLGGCGGSSFLDGHDYTYEGSKNGKLVDILIENRCMNPIIFFDELDKVSDTNFGREIIGTLTHLTDSTQNDSVTDKYFSDIKFDFSKCLIIFSFNDAKLINPILRDRITIINVSGFKRKEKLEIAKRFTTPKLAKNIGLDPKSFVIPDDVYESVIDSYCSEEQGIRKLEKCIETILMKINLYRLTGMKEYLENEAIDETFTITKKMASKILNRFFNVEDGANQMIAMMYS